LTRASGHVNISGVDDPEGVNVTNATRVPDAALDVDTATLRVVGVVVVVV